VIGVLLLGSATSAVVASGGKVLGSARHPLNTADFSAFLLQAQASGAKVVAPANAGGDMVNATKQADEFGLTRAGKTVVSLLTFITDVNSVGLKAMQGLTFITAFYWHRDDESRAWSKRFFELRKRMPTMAHAAIYSAVRHYLRAIEAAGTDEAKAVMAKMREIPVNDFYARRTGGYAKTAAWCTTCTSCRSKRRRNRTARGTITRILSTIPGDQAFRPWTKADVRWSNSDRRLCR
jgi:branched-chain amino acid transport system substrate-binding protein